LPHMKDIEKIRSLIPDLMISDRGLILKGLKRLKSKSRNAGKPEHARVLLRSLLRKAESSVAKAEKRLRLKPHIDIPQALPISSRTREIVDTIKKNRVVIIAGDTGSGKSTQIPKMCLKAGQGVRGIIGCTQPRRIAATTIAGRIAEELGEDIGRSVGYRIRFKDRTSPGAYIKMLTDGMLLAEAQRDPFLNDYDTVIVDEAHERSLNIDFILGILKRLLKKRKNLKVIITSATIDTGKFSAAFDSAPVIEVSGRMYPVDLEYMPPDETSGDSEELTYVDRALEAVEKVRKESLFGGILIFMPTERDILETCERLKGRKYTETLILPLFARLPASRQKRIFSSFAGQKIIVATNVAETSLTVPGIRYVIDTGLARISRYTPRTRTTSLPISPISISSADQRKGRCGRVEKGKCIRLYSEEDYLSRIEFTPPEILRANLAEVILRMISLKLGDIASFPFIDKPGGRSVKDGFDLLMELGALEKAGNRYLLTEKGKSMARMPLDPKISRMMIEAQKEGCIKEAAVIASALSIQDPRERPLEAAGEADRAHEVFTDHTSDFMSLLNIWNSYHASLKKLRTQNRMRRFCREHFLSFARIKEWRDIHDQIISILKEQGINPDSTINGTPEALYQGVHKTILSGFLSNIALKKEKYIYGAAKGREVMLFPGSGLFKKPPAWIVAAEMVKTSRLFARTAARIDPGWLEALGKGLCRYSYSDPHWEKSRGEVVASEQVSLYGLIIIEKRPVSYGPIDPEKSAGIFMEQALVSGNIKGNFPFLKHNLELVNRITEMEAKVRRRNILADEDRMARFYEERLGRIYSSRSLAALIRKTGDDAFLRMSEKDLVTAYPEDSELDQYPDHLKIGKARFSFTYRFAPGAEEDGVTINIPSSLASQVPPDKLEWTVPGLFREKVTALIKGLPKRYRRRLVPVSRSVDIILSEMEKQDIPLKIALSRFIYNRFGTDIPPEQWPDKGLPEHLKMRVSIIDHKGKEITSARDSRILSTKGFGGRPEELDSWKAAVEKLEISGITKWDFDALPERIDIDSSLAAYPALTPEGDALSIRLFSDRNKAETTHREGMGRLFEIHFRKEIKFIKRILVFPANINEPCEILGGKKDLEASLLVSLTSRLFKKDFRSRDEFDLHAQKISPLLLTEAKELLDASIDVVSAYADTRGCLYSLEKSNRKNNPALLLCSQLRDELEELVPKRFPEKYLPERLAQIPRYTRAISIRAERAVNDLEKDKNKAIKITPFISVLRGMQDGISEHASEGKRSAVKSFRWMIEELKVSIFAQELRTPYPVSEKRLIKMADEINRML